MYQSWHYIDSISFRNEGGGCEVPQVSDYPSSPSGLIIIGVDTENGRYLDPKLGREHFTRVIIMDGVPQHS